MVAHTSKLSTHHDLGGQPGLQSKLLVRLSSSKSLPQTNKIPTVESYAVYHGGHTAVRPTRCDYYKWITEGFILTTQVLIYKTMLRDGGISTSAGACHQAWQPEFHPWNPHDGRKNQLGEDVLWPPYMCYGMQACVGARVHIHAHTHRINKIKF